MLLKFSLVTLPLSSPALVHLMTSNFSTLSFCKSSKSLAQNLNCLLSLDSLAEVESELNGVMESHAKKCDWALDWAAGISCHQRNKFFSLLRTYLSFLFMLSSFIDLEFLTILRILKRLYIFLSVSRLK